VAKAISDFEFTNNMLVFLDITRIVSVFVDQQSGINADLLAMMDFDVDALSEVCRSEIRDMAGVMPRITMGYTEMTADEMGTNLIMEFRPDLAAELKTLTAPVRGLGVARGDLFSFGTSIDLNAARDFYSARLDAWEAAPYECEEFQNLNASAAQGRMVLEQPVMPMIYSIKGFLASIDAMDGLDVATKTPPTSVDAQFLLSTDNPQGLLAFGSMMNPQLAGLQLQSDGVPVEFPLPPISPALSNAYIAMNEDSIAIAVGEGSESTLADLMQEGFADPAPFMSVSMDAGRYYEFMADVMRTASASNDEEMSEEALAAMTEMMTMVGSWMGYMTGDVLFTDRGIEMPSTMEMK
jgi:hypothetical protein